MYCYELHVTLTTEGCIFDSCGSLADMSMRHSRESSTEKVSEEYFRERCRPTTLESFDFVFKGRYRAKIKFGFKEEVCGKGSEGATRKSRARLPIVKVVCH
jgi:hypothetical protein